MALYREGEELVEAFCFDYEGGPDPDWLIRLIMEGDVTIHHQNSPPVLFLMVVTPEGTFRVNHGDYVVRNSDGSVFPCEPEIFNMTYEEVK